MARFLIGSFIIHISFFLISGAVFVKPAGKGHKIVQVSFVPSPDKKSGDALKAAPSEIKEKPPAKNILPTEKPEKPKKIPPEGAVNKKSAVRKQRAEKTAAETSAKAEADGQLLSPAEEGGSFSAESERASGAAAARTAPEENGLSYTEINFNNILDAVRRNLKYPVIARKNGWTGRVEISFRVDSNGYASDIKIYSSCGYPMLDRQAAEAVRKSAPFPKPASDTSIIIPILFELK